MFSKCCSTLCASIISCLRATIVLLSDVWMRTWFVAPILLNLICLIKLNRHGTKCCANQFPEVADKKEGVGTYCFILRLGLRITFSMDKATAHTKGYVETH